MSVSDLSIILGNQLVRPALIPMLTKHPIFMCESDDLCTHFKYHKLKLAYHLITMREYRDELVNLGHDCHYFELPLIKTQIFFDTLSAFCHSHGVSHLYMIEIEDHFFEKQMYQFCETHAIQRHTYPSPLFLTPRPIFNAYLAQSKKPFMKTFYTFQRERLNILMAPDGPTGGKWSFDEDNRKKTPKDIQFTPPTYYPESQYKTVIVDLINQKFNSHVGDLDTIWVPTNRNTAKKWATHFITHRLISFGDYEDAIDYRSDFLFHSALSPLLNIGLITPSEMIELLPKTSRKIPINSLEGFYRQLIGWREFIRGIYHHYHETQYHHNFFNHQGRLNHQWDNGTTGIPPLDDAIKQVLRLGYTHHINRLMIIGNMMLLCRVHPHDVYNWFMRFFLDSADWVMGPNVFGMSQFSDGGIFATKPYFCGSNYILKMSHYAKGPWCRIVDALYWQFVCDHQAFLSTNYRLKFMVSTYNRFTSDKRAEIKTISDSFINSVTAQHPTG